MQYEFDEKIDEAIQKSVRAAIRHSKERQNLAQESGSPQRPPIYEESASIGDQVRELSTRAYMNKRRTPSLRDLFETSWAQKPRNYATQSQLREAYEARTRRH